MDTDEMLGYLRFLAYGIMVVCLVAFLCKKANAFEDDAFKNQINCKECLYSTEVYKSVYEGQKNRYNEDQLRNDPEVLVASAKHESKDIREPKEEVIRVTQDVTDEPIIISYDLGKMPYTISEE